LKSAFNDFNKSRFGLDELRITNSLLGKDAQLLIVNNFKNTDKTTEYLNQVKNDSKLFLNFKESDKFQHYLISQENFSILMSEKKLDDYIPFYQSSYPKQ
jgi:hypothetical protein